MTNAEEYRIYDEYAKAMEAEFEAVGAELGISTDNAADIWYLRQRSRWSPEHETRCVSYMKAGHSLPVLAGEETQYMNEHSLEATQ